jgi:colanic acid/amylovoran biosynthesis protein
MKISITGVTGFRNRGVEALLQPILKGLAERYAGCSIVVYSGSPEYDEGRIPMPGVKVLPEGRGGEVKGRVARKLNRLGFGFGEVCYPGWGELEGSDLLLVTGGDVFSSEYGDWSFDRHLIPMRVAKKHNISFVIFAQSIGPFTSERHRERFLEVARFAQIISVREERTMKYLTEGLGLPKEQVISVADPAFLLEADPVAVGYAGRSLRHSGPLVAVSISQAISEWTGHEREARLGVWSTLVGRMINDWNASVVLVPHVQEAYANDVIACTNIWRNLNFHSNLTVLGADLSAAEYKGIISSCDMVIAERMHAGIAGLSSGVCTCIVAYSIKARGIMERMVGKEHSAAGALVEGSSFGDVEDVWRKIEHTWNNRTDIRDHLRRTVPQEQIQSRRAFEILPDTRR